MRDLKKERTTDRIEKRKKAQNLAGLKPTTTRALPRRCVLYHCLTIAARQCYVILTFDTFKFHFQYFENLISRLSRSRNLEDVFPILLIMLLSIPLRLTSGEEAQLFNTCGAQEQNAILNFNQVPVQVVLILLQ